MIKEQEKHMARAFEKFIPVPQKNGVIMVIEKEFGPVGADDWVNIAAGLADIVKCTFGTASLYNEEILQEKVEIYQKSGISPMIGGTLTEVAILCAGGYTKKCLGPYLKYAKSLGFTHLEFSDGTIYIPDERRADIIQMCIQAGFTVISEVGKKDAAKDAAITLHRRIELMTKDLRSGAAMVIIEARESGKGIGVMSKSGEVNFEELDTIIQAVGLENTMIEAPNKDQQQSIYMKYGPGASIGNVQPKDILAAAALRAGLRGDTIGVLRKEHWKKYHDAVGAPQDYTI
ncbi:MAG: phosphosulfolactate synthase [Planctomycetaceae bacterium]|nr:MAG: phosphosulfolactate synthase [Planctomycetaceae bacterium]